MKSFTRGSKKKLGRSSSKKKEVQSHDEDTFNELFGGALRAAEDTSAFDDVKDDVSAAEDLPILQLSYDNVLSGDKQRPPSFGVDPLEESSSLQRPIHRTPSSFLKQDVDTSEKHNGVNLSIKPARRDRREPGVHFASQNEHFELNPLPPLTGAQEVNISSERPSVYQDESVTSNQQAQPWKERYEALQRDYDALQEQYKAFQEFHRKHLETSRKKISDLENELQAKDEEVRRAKTQTVPIGTVSGSKSEAEKTIASQNEEIQKLLEQRISLEAELARLRYTRGTATPQDFDHERLVNNLKAKLREKEEVIRQLEEDVSAARHELARVGGLMGAVAEQMEVDEVKKKKKKGWFGSSSKSKKIDTSKLTASDLDAARRDAAAKAGVSESSLPSPRPAEQKQDTTAYRPVAPASGDIAITTKRIIDVERENARLEGEIAILEKQKTSLTENLERTKAQLEILLKAKELRGAELKTVELIQSATVPLPLEGGSEADRLRLMVHVQQGALERLSIKSQKLEAVVAKYTASINAHPLQSTTEKELKLLQRELLGTREQLMEAEQKQRQIQEKYEQATLALNEAERELERIQKQLSEQQEISTAAIKRLKDESESYVTLVGDLMSQTNNTRTELVEARQSHLTDAKRYQGELRALRNKRTERLPSTPAHNRLVDNNRPSNLSARQPSSAASKPAQPASAQAVCTPDLNHNTCEDSKTNRVIQMIPETQQTNCTGAGMFQQSQRVTPPPRMRPVGTVEFKTNRSLVSDPAGYAQKSSYNQYKNCQPHVYDASPPVTSTTGSAQVIASPALLQWAASPTVQDNSRSASCVNSYTRKSGSPSASRLLDSSDNISSKRAPNPLTGEKSSLSATRSSQQFPKSDEPVHLQAKRPSRKTAPSAKGVPLNQVILNEGGMTSIDSLASAKPQDNSSLSWKASPQIIESITIPEKKNASLGQNGFLLTDPRLLFQAKGSDDLQANESKQMSSCIQDKILNRGDTFEQSPGKQLAGRFRSSGSADFVDDLFTGKNPTKVL